MISKDPYGGTGSQESSSIEAFGSLILPDGTPDDDAIQNAIDRRNELGRKLNNQQEPNDVRFALLDEATQLSRQLGELAKAGIISMDMPPPSSVSLPVFRALDEPPEFDPTYRARQLEQLNDIRQQLGDGNA